MREQWASFKEHWASVKELCKSFWELWASFREHMASFREHLASFREHLAPCREHLASFREHFASFREHLASCRVSAMYVRHTAQHQGTVQQRTGCRPRGRKAGKGTIVHINQSNALVVISTTCEQGQGRVRQVDLIVDHVVGDKLGLEEGRSRLHERLMRFHPV